MSWSNTIGQVVNGFTKIYQPLVFPDGSVQSSASNVSVLGSDFVPVTAQFQAGVNAVVEVITTAPVSAGIYLVQMSFAMENTSGVTKTLSQLNWNVTDTLGLISLSPEISPFDVPINIETGTRLSNPSVVIFNVPAPTNGLKFAIVYNQTTPASANFTYTVDDLIAIKLA